MPEKTIYLAQTFWWVDGRLEAGEPLQFMRVNDARAAGEAMAGSAPGVAVYSLVGEPAVDLWGDPQIVEAFGCAPDVAA